MVFGSRVTLHSWPGTTRAAVHSGYRGWAHLVSHAEEGEARSNGDMEHVLVLGEAYVGLGGWQPLEYAMRHEVGIALHCAAGYIEVRQRQIRGRQRSKADW